VSEEHSVLLAISLHRPLTEDLMNFWQKKSPSELFPLLAIALFKLYPEYTFNTCIGIRIPKTGHDFEDKYQSFFDSMKPNYSGKYWTVLE
jgi:hypothetical protein